MMRGHLRRLILILGCLVWMIASPSGAAPLDVSAVTSKIHLLGQMRVLEDPSASLTPLQALSSSGWKPATASFTQLGTTDAARWLKLHVTNRSAHAVTRWLVLGNPRLEHVDFYRIDPATQTVQEAQRTGLAHASLDQQIKGKDFIFAIAPAPLAQSLLLVRVQGRTLSAMEPELWEPLLFREQEAANDLLYLVSMMALATVTVFLFANALASRNWILFLLAAWILVGVAYDFSFHGYLKPYLLAQGGELAVRSTQAFATAGILMAAIFISVYLNYQKHNYLRFFHQVVIVFYAALLVLALFGDLRWSIDLSLLGIVILPVSTLALILINPVNVPHLRLFKSVFILFLVLLVVRMAMIVGFIPKMDLFSLFAALVYKLFITFSLLYVVVKRSVVQAEFLDAQQIKLMQEERTLQFRLEEMIELRSQALQATLAADEANRSKIDLLARIGHELRGPMNAIVGYAGVLSQSSGPSREYARNIERASRNLLEMMGRLIEAARSSGSENPIPLQAVYLSDFLRQSATFATALGRSNDNRVTYQVVGALPDVVQLDGSHLRQVLEHLLWNATESTRGGQIDFSVRVALAEEGASERLILTVSDTGRGIPEAALATVFEPFERVDASHEDQDFRVRLMISRHWVKRMGGDIDVTSPRGSGTTVQVSIPLRPCSEAAIPVQDLYIADDPDLHLNGTGRLVWVVDDCPAVGETLCDNLGQQGFSTRALTCGMEAMGRIGRLGEKIPEIVLTDLKMPGADGRQVLNRVRTQWPGVPVVLMTSAPEAASEEDLKFSAVLSKPLRLNVLYSTMARLLDLDTTHGLKTSP